MVTSPVCDSAISLPLRGRHLIIPTVPEGCAGAASSSSVSVSPFSCSAVAEGKGRLPPPGWGFSSSLSFCPLCRLLQGDSPHSPQPPGASVRTCSLGELPTEGSVPALRAGPCLVPTPCKTSKSMTERNVLLMLCGYVAIMKNVNNDN